MPERPKQLTIRDERKGDTYSFCCVRIDDTGSLVLEAVDGGPEVERMFGDSDVEAFVTLKPQEKDALLLHGPVANVTVNGPRVIEPLVAGGLSGSFECYDDAGSLIDERSFGDDGGGG